tara:strand:- start:475 stop:1008 length:534 start_codon:yes stop_codon:yes gene_type:complete
MFKTIAIVVGLIILFLLGYVVFSNLNKDDINPSGIDNNQNDSNKPASINFKGDKGEILTLEDNQVELDAGILDDNKAHYYNVEVSSGKTIYFFAIKDKTGTYRAAANACQVCYDTYLGFSQDGDYMVCNTCGNKYPLEKIATEKGGCNPGPINPDLKVENGKIIITEAELNEVLNLF